MRKKMPKPMTDREILLLAYGAMKAADHADQPDLRDIIKLLEEHLWPPADDPADAKPNEEPEPE